MDFSLTEDQRIFRESIERVVTDLYPFDKRQAAVATPKGYLDEHWQQLAELGCMAAPFPEACGGLDGGPIELMLIAEQFGRGLVTSPYMATVVLGGHAVLFAGNEAQRHDILPQVADGSLKLALAYGERQARYTLDDVVTTAKPDGDGYVLAGQKDVVFYAQDADIIVVVARTSGGQRSRDGLSLFLVPASVSGLTMTGYGTQDGSRAANILLDGVKVGADALLGEAGQACPVLERVIDHAIAFACADAVGSMWEVYSTTLEYLKTREQFGQTLGSFQALQHRMVDVYTECELAQSTVYEVTLSLDKDDTVRRQAASSAKFLIGQAARHVGEEGVQLHGGMGMTMDVPLGHHLKRAMMMNASFGDMRHHLNLLAQTVRAAAA
ncbi:MAG: acyl-CoA dehydrogenase family protein [Pseudomonadota bacterium]